MGDSGAAFGSDAALRSEGHGAGGSGEGQDVEGSASYAAFVGAGYSNGCAVACSNGASAACSNGASAVCSNGAPAARCNDAPVVFGNGAPVAAPVPSSSDCAAFGSAVEAAAAAAPPLDAQITVDNPTCSDIAYARLRSCFDNGPANVTVLRVTSLQSASAVLRARFQEELLHAADFVPPGAPPPGAPPRGVPSSTPPLSPSSLVVNLSWRDLLLAACQAAMPDALFDSAPSELATAKYLVYLHTFKRLVDQHAWAAVFRAVMGNGERTSRLEYRSLYHPQHAGVQDPFPGTIRTAVALRLFVEPACSALTAVTLDAAAATFAVCSARNALLWLNRGVGPTGPSGHGKFLNPPDGPGPPDRLKKGSHAVLGEQGVPGPYDAPNLSGGPGPFATPALVPFLEASACATRAFLTHPQIRRIAPLLSAVREELRGLDADGVAGGAGAGAAGAVAASAFPPTPPSPPIPPGTSGALIIALALKANKSVLYKLLRDVPPAAVCEAVRTPVGAAWAAEIADFAVGEGFELWRPPEPLRPAPSPLHPASTLR